MAFDRVYKKENLNNAVKAMRGAILIYCLSALAFACLCSVFVVLYISVGVSVILCFAVNFTLSVVFVWFSVIFFKLKLYVCRERLRFYRLQDNALITYSRGTYTGETRTGAEGALNFRYLTFKTAEGLKTYRVGEESSVVFGTDKAYDLELAGDLITGYAEAENG